MSGGTSPEATSIQQQSARRLRDLLAQLPEQHRCLLEMAYFQGLSQQELAARLRQPLGTEKTRMRTGMGRLRELLASV